MRTEPPPTSSAADTPGLSRAPAPPRRTGDVSAVLVLVALPVLVFGFPALFGHVVVPGDDLTQNYPLRVLAGQQIRAGNLPLFDPDIWSGAPLLADWNAGAAYPLTWLFAILPGVAAWTVNMIATWAVAGVGMFAFLRALRLASLASFLGALSFAFAGAMSAQVGHLGLVAGMSWVPLELLAILRLSQQQSAASRLSWIAILAAAFGLTILAGEPRAVDNAGVVVLLYACWRIARLGRRCAPAAASVTAGVILGVCVGAVQLLPGLAAIATSERSASSMALFNAGSLAPKWLLLLLVPDLLGGSGSFGQPSFFASYNLAEVTSYVGILPLVAALVLLSRLRLRSRAPEWLIWHVVAIVGAVFALGGQTPLGRLLVHVPLFGDQRLQSRNIMVLDLALAVLLAYWADRPFGTGSRSLSWGRRLRIDLETVLGALPPTAVIVVAVFAVMQSTRMLGWLGVSARVAGVAGQHLRPWLVPYAVIGAGALALVIFGQRLRPDRRRRLLAAFVVTDLVVFTVLAVVAVGTGFGGRASASVSAGRTVSRVSGQRASHTSAAVAAVRPISALGYGGRYAVYDPGLLYDGELTTLASPDLNVMTATPSVQGYSSIVDRRYAVTTGSHYPIGGGQDLLAPSAIGNGTLDQLDTTILLTPAAYMITSSRSGGPPGGPPGTGRRVITADHDSTWYFARQLDVTRVTVPDSDARQSARTGTQIGLVAANGGTKWFSAKAIGTTVLGIDLRQPVTSVAIVGRAGRRASTLGPPTIVVSGGAVFVADGQLQDALAPPRWAYAGQDGSFGIFVNRDARGALVLRGVRGGSVAGASARVLTGPAADPTSAAVSSPHGVRVVRSVAAIPGWTATWKPAHGPPVTLSVGRSGLVQSVVVPPGRGVLTWTYDAPGFLYGALLSLFGVVLVILLLLARRSRLAALLRYRRPVSGSPSALGETLAEPRV